ncbi:SRPBCC family protein [Flagellimonas algicola]|uniref:SRPBCC domain-containing protein n=1 Tax=Flagellimonas algicola TaxID=2583815 RepID=A0ABY2WGD6_9FLAO|nr:SRPBCC domain-containing protein [Allomuricauda algicola]TMU50609.1 SRPBCC domain-containing protein [Allomuricauda algicola]
MSQLTFDSFTKKIYIKSTIEKLYWCWGTEAGICSWFLRSAVYTSANGEQRNPEEHIQAGDSYTWMWHNWDGEEKGTVLKANGSDSMEISFADSKVSVTLEQHETAVLVSLKQHQIPTDETSKLNIHHGCSNGWTFWLANLKAYLEHGILLNETEFDLRNIPLSGYEFVNM